MGEGIEWVGREGGRGCDVGWEREVIGSVVEGYGVREGWGGGLEWGSLCMILCMFFFYRADKVREKHPGLEPVTRCHSYEIQYKHYYKCIECSFRYVGAVLASARPQLLEEQFSTYVSFCSRIGRYCKSMNLNTARCPHCLRYMHY